MRGNGRGGLAFSFSGSPSFFFFRLRRRQRREEGGNISAWRPGSEQFKSGSWKEGSRGHSALGNPFCVPPFFSPFSPRLPSPRASFLAVLIPLWRLAERLVSESTNAIRKDYSFPPFTTLGPRHALPTKYSRRLSTGCLIHYYQINENRAMFV